MLIDTRDGEIFLSKYNFMIVVLTAPLVVSPPCAAERCFSSDLDWKQYADPNHGFVIQYPNITRPEMAQVAEPELLSRTMFNFSQLDSGGPESWDQRGGHVR
jgi:hypothetical protein